MRDSSTSVSPPRSSTPGNGAASPQVHTIGRLKFDLASRRVFCGPDEVHLTAQEWRLIRVLIQHRGTTVRRRELAERVWQRPLRPDSRAIELAIYKLRRKIEEHPARPSQLLTIYGKGYQLV
ncbi:MAG: response regulator transcription factor [Bacteroidota bacterium]